MQEIGDFELGQGFEAFGAGFGARIDDHHQSESGWVVCVGLDITATLGGVEDGRVLSAAIPITRVSL